MDLVRTDAYNADHKWYSAGEFTDGLLTRRIYLVGDATRELQYTYDEKRWLKESVLYYKAGFVCRFVYDRLPDGTVKRTRALGPNGEQWAEYPDMEIYDVKINGEALSGESIIHKTGNWWNPSSTTTRGAIEVLTDTMGVDFGPYLTRVVRDIKGSWYSLIPEVARAPMRKKGKVSIEFSILKGGSVAEMKQVESSGDAALDRAAWAGITAASPFSPLPSEFRGQYVTLRFHFYYNIDMPVDKPIDVVVLPGREIQLAAGAKQQFSASVPGVTNSTVYWSLGGSSCAGAACGSISGDGLYTAPLNFPNPATVIATATSATVPTKKGSSTVTIQPSLSH